MKKNSLSERLIICLKNYFKTWIIKAIKKLSDQIQIIYVYCHNKTLDNSEPINKNHKELF